MGQVETSYIFREALLSLIVFLQFMIVVRAVFSWLPSNISNSVIGDIIIKITEPVIRFMQKITNNKLIMDRVDFTPIAAYFLLTVLRMLILRSY